MMDVTTNNAHLDASTFNAPAYLRDPKDKSEVKNESNQLPPANEEVIQSASTGNEAAAALNSTDSNLYYDMSGVKILIIFNQYQYMKTEYMKTLGTVPSTRNGTFRDVESLVNTFSNLGFRVIPPHTDLGHEEILKHLTDLCNEDHTNTSCVAVAFMSHGIGEYVCAADRMFPLADITDTLLTAPNLTGKPKLCFIQACREKHTQPRPPPAIPMDTHFLIFYATYEDYVSIRTSEGTWFMQALCKVLDEYHKSMDLADMTILVNKMVSEKSIYEDNGKQQSVSQYSLTKFLML